MSPQETSLSSPTPLAKPLLPRDFAGRWRCGTRSPGSSWRHICPVMADPCPLGVLSEGVGKSRCRAGAAPDGGPTWWQNRVVGDFGHHIRKNSAPTEPRVAKFAPPDRRDVCPAHRHRQIRGPDRDLVGVDRALLFWGGEMGAASDEEGAVLRRGPGRHHRGVEAGGVAVGRGGSKGLSGTIVSPQRRRGRREVLVVENEAFAGFTAEAQRARRWPSAACTLAIPFSLSIPHSFVSACSAPLR